MNITQLLDQSIPDSQRWESLTKEQRLTAQKDWIDTKTKKTISLFNDNIDLLAKSWVATELLSDDDIKFISIVQVVNDVDGGLDVSYKFTINTVYQCQDYGARNKLHNKIADMNIHGTPLLYIENRSTKHHLISAVSLKIDDDMYCGLFDFPFNTIEFSYDQPLFDELVDKYSLKQKKLKSQVKQRKLESEKEDELYTWLRLQGLDAHRQVKTSNGNKLDIWIPNQMIIEVKRSNVTGNDACQAMEYVQGQCLPVVIVGDKISSSASRGIKAFNELTHGNKIIFVTWDVIKDYLKGRFNK